MLRITNTLTGKKAPWTPRVAGRASLYVCGVTVYDDCHLGHARSAVVFDVIRNYLEYRGIEVRYVKNFTDVDDKILNRAASESVDWKEISAKYIAAYEADMARLAVRPPTLSPRATDHIPEMIALIERLIAKDAAYPVDGDVYFSVARFASYGQLSKREQGEIMAGARVEVNERKRNPLDFALWKGAKPGEPSWESPWGAGRPGWHIECSAMALKHLGQTFDLHGGGSDLIFPHHENEIAQSEAATGVAFVACWIHHGFVMVDREKMSKSLGNFFTVRAVFTQSSHFPEAVVAEVVRYYLLSTHYRSGLDFADASLKEAKAALDPFYDLFQKVAEQGAPPAEAGGVEPDLSAFEAAMDDDFNTPRALAVLQTQRAEINRRLNDGRLSEAASGVSALRAMGAVLGLFRMEQTAWSHQPWESGAKVGAGVLDDAAIQTLIARRDAARQAKDWPAADAIRRQLAEAGVVIEDRPDGATRVKR